MRGVAAPARLHCEPVPGRRAALPDQTLIGFDTASRRREGAFLLLFFFSFISKREPFWEPKAPPLLPFSSKSPWFLLCCSVLFHSSLYVPILTPSIFISPIKSSGLLFLLSSSFIVPLTWMLSSRSDPPASQHQKITFVLQSAAIAVAVKTLRATKSVSFRKPATY